MEKNSYGNETVGRIVKIKRIFDILMSLALTGFLFIPMLIIAFIVKLSSDGPVLFWSDRVGKNNTIFRMPKFRTMHTNTPVVPTHLLKDPDRYLTKAGRFLRKSSLDELPQLFSVVKGDMSMVGPRPALYNQDDLVELRTKNGVHVLTPGVTGWAQINGRDELTIPAKVEFDVYYLKHLSFFFDLKIVFLTLVKVLLRDGVRH